MHKDDFCVLWKGVRGMCWNSLLVVVSELLNIWPHPDVIIVHLGGNNIGKKKTVDLLFQIKQDFHYLRILFTSTVLIFSQRSLPDYYG